MPSPMFQFRLPEDLLDWIVVRAEESQVSPSAFVRDLLTAEQMKEAVAPLVPTSVRFDSSIEKVGPATVEDWKAFREGAGFQTKETSLGRFGITPNEFDAHKAKPKARRKESVKDSGASSPSSGGTKRGDGTPQSALSRTESPSLPAHCNRGACTGTIKPNGRCIRCNQEPKR
jgi:hypothetical protein